MTYDQTIEWLYKQLPMFSRIGIAAYKKDLHNTIRLCQFLHDPQQSFKTIHVAGTNGKGSTSHMLAAVLQQAGYKTGLYTSPHIKDFRERIRVNGQVIDKDFVIDFVQRTMDITEEIKPSFFELTVAMAFDYFAHEKVDIAIIETGLGGRLDSTNVISPVLSVITNIGYDHMNMLGNTLAEIAFEKAGIIKNNTPVVIGETLPETLPVFQKKASEMNAAIHFTGDRFTVLQTESTGSYLSCSIRNRTTNELIQVKTDLAGMYQSKNVCTVLHAIELLNETGINIPVKAIQSGLESVKKITGIRGRWDMIQVRPALILDVAHNEDGIKQVLQQLKINFPASRVHFVLGFVNDKDLSKILTLFPSGENYYFSNAHIPRALPHETLGQVAATAGLNGNGFDDVNSAIEQARLAAKEDDVIIVCGSFFIISEVNDRDRSLS